MKKKTFKTETKQLLKLMIHSLYSNREIFLRELVSNASDALDKLRFQALQDANLKNSNKDLKIVVKVDSKKNQIVITDNGIGMTEAEVVDSIGTIARSGTANFLEKITGDQKKDSQLIGQFGVGFYSTFMVASKVTILTKAASGIDDAVQWQSDGSDSYTLKTIKKETTGTEVIIDLNDDAKEFADKHRAMHLLKKYSQYINFPLYLEDQEGNEELINDSEAIWLKSKRSVKDEQYKEFYKYLSFDGNDPLAWIHNKVEGANEYSSLLFIPKKSPFDLWNRETPKGLKLFIQRVFIMDDAAHFLPLYLRFVKGVIDSSDLPLNVSREILQDHPLVETIKKSLTKRVIDALRKMQQDDRESYLGFWKEFGLVLKEGPAESFEDKDKIAELFMFHTSTDLQKFCTLDEYIERMPKEQEKIFYAIGESLEAVSQSPHIEKLQESGTEVLLLTDRIDEWLMTSLFNYKDKEFADVAKEPISEEGIKVSKEDSELIEKLNKSLKDKVEKVLTSSRLTKSAVCLVRSKHEPGIQMRRILEAAGQTMPESKPMLEINLKHKLIKKLSKLDSKEFNQYAKFLFDYAVIAEGGNPTDPASFLRQLDKFLS
ncbi:MAG: molecular chaperone HtpG [Gammaproteobacteria bacterium]